MNCTVIEATSSSNIEEDLYEFKDEPCSPVSIRSPGSFRYPSRREQYAADSATSVAVIGKAAAPCKVCGDKASGYHYGVTSCEGCKGFFRRSIQKQIEYRCLREGKCLVIRLNRNRCQFCRFKKCLAVGMSRDSVRYGRVPKRPRDFVSSDSMPDLGRNVIETAAVPFAAHDEGDESSPRNGLAKELVNVVTEAHKNNNAYTEELRRTLQHQTIVLKLNDVDGEASGGEEAASSTTDRVSDMRSVLWYNVALRMTPSVQHVVEFAKRLPGFQTLPQDDQLILIKLGFFEVWLTRVTRLSTPEHIVFEDGTAISQNQLHIIYDAEFASAMLAYVQSLMKMQMSEEEMAMYTSSLLMCPHRLGLSDPEHISGLHLAINDAFQSIVMNSGSPDAAARMEAFAAATLEVRKLGARHNELLVWCREHWPRLVLPALFSEIFDIPKIDEDDGSATDKPVPTPQVG